MRRADGLLLLATASFDGSTRIILRLTRGTSSTGAPDLVTNSEVFVETETGDAIFVGVDVTLVPGRRLLRVTDKGSGRFEVIVAEKPLPWLVDVLLSSFRGVDLAIEPDEGLETGEGFGTEPFVLATRVDRVFADGSWIGVAFRLAVFDDLVP